MKKKHRKRLERVTRGIWSSLESHLPHCYNNKSAGGKKFHRKCVREYAKMIDDLAKTMK